MMSHRAEFSLGEWHSTVMVSVCERTITVSPLTAAHTSDIPDRHVYHFSRRMEMTSLMDTASYVDI